MTILDILSECETDKQQLKGGIQRTLQIMPTEWELNNNVTDIL